MAFNGSGAPKRLGIECLGYTPAVTQSFVQSIAMDATKIGPLSNRQIKPVMFKTSVGSCIIGLLFACSPSAIFRIIAKRIVYSIERHSLLGLPHIGKKVRKIHPSFAYFYSSAAVILKSRTSRIKASLFDAKPNVMKSAFGCAMRGIGTMHYTCSFRGALVPKASARNYISIFKVVTTDIFNISAIAQTNKMSVALRNLLNNKLSKLLADGNRVKFFSGHKTPILYNNIISQGV